LTARQQRAISALLKEPTVAKAAAAAGIGETTLFRWLNEPRFSAVYRDARAKVTETTLAALQAASSEAVETLRDVLKSELARPGEKVSAARSILEFSFKAREQCEFEQRLKALELASKLKGAQ
jgi:hypothetical protein